jgi:hypothetical protein
MPTAAETIARSLAGYTRRRRLIAAARAVCIAISFIGLWCLAACVADRCVGFNRPARCALDAIPVAGALFLMIGPIHHLFRRFDLVAAAVAIEHQLPALSGRLSTAVSRPVAGTSNEMLAAVTEEVAAEISRRPRVSLRPLLVPAIVAAVVAAIAVIAFRSPRLAIAGSARRLLHPGTVLPVVTSTQLIMDPLLSSVPVGRPLTIACVAAPVDPTRVVLHVSDDAGRSWTQWPMTADPAAPGRYAFIWTAMAADLQCYVTAGDAVSPTAVVIATARPAVSELRNRIETPFDPHHSSVTVSTNDGSIDAVDGSVVTTEAVCTRRVARGTLALARGRFDSMPTSDPRVLRFRWTVRGDDAGELNVTGTDGQPGDPRSIQVHARPDRPPTIRFFDPADVVLVSPGGSIDAGYQAADDFGLAAVTTETRINERRWQMNARTFKDVPTSATEENAIGLAAMDVFPGDVVAVRVRARDSAGQATVSDLHFAIVVPNPGDPRDARRLADLVAAVEWIDRLGGDAAAAGNVRVCLERAARNAPMPAWAAFATDLARRPGGSIRADVAMLLDADRADQVLRMRTALVWLDGRAAVARAGSARHAARDRLALRITEETRKLGIDPESADVAGRLRRVIGSTVDLIRSRPEAPPAVIHSGPAIAAPRPPQVPPAGRRAGDADVPGYEDALRLYFERLKAAGHG